MNRMSKIKKSRLLFLSLLWYNVLKNENCDCEMFCKMFINITVIRFISINYFLTCFIKNAMFLIKCRRNWSTLILYLMFRACLRNRLLSAIKKCLIKFNILTLTIIKSQKKIMEAKSDLKDYCEDSRMINSTEIIINYSRRGVKSLKLPTFKSFSLSLSLFPRFHVAVEERKEKMREASIPETRSKCHGDGTSK